MRGFADRELQIIAMIGAFAVGGAIVAPVVVWSGTSKADDGPALDEMEAIEATLAYKSATPPKQPQKPVSAPPPPADVPGMSLDDQKKPDPKKDDKDKKPTPADPPLDYNKYKRTDDDDPTGKPTTDPAIGSFDGSEFGFAEESRGDPYFQKLVADLLGGWEYPEILADAGVPVGCLRLDPDGKVMDTKFKEKSGNGDLDDSVERALANIKKERNKEPVAVPTHLLRAATTKWVCFKFKVKK